MGNDGIPVEQDAKASEMTLFIALYLETKQNLWRLAEELHRYPCLREKEGRYSGALAIHQPAGSIVLIAYCGFDAFQFSDLYQACDHEGDKFLLVLHPQTANGFNVPEAIMPRVRRDTHLANEDVMVRGYSDEGRPTDRLFANRTTLIRLLKAFCQGDVDLLIQSIEQLKYVDGDHNPNEDYFVQALREGLQ